MHILLCHNHSIQDGCTSYCLTVPIGLVSRKCKCLWETLNTKILPIYNLSGGIHWTGFLTKQMRLVSVNWLSLFTVVVVLLQLGYIRVWRNQQNQYQTMLCTRGLPHACTGIALSNDPWTVAVEKPWCFSSASTAQNCWTKEFSYGRQTHSDCNTRNTSAETAEPFRSSGILIQSPRSWVMSRLMLTLGSLACSVVLSELV